MIDDDDPDDMRTAYRPPDAPVVSPHYHANAAPGPIMPAAPAPHAMERTQFIGPGFVAPSPAATTDLAAPAPVPAAPPPHASLPHASLPRHPPPVWQPMPMPMPMPMPAPPAPTPPVPTAIDAAYTGHRLGAPSAALATIQSPRHAAGGMNPQPRGAKVALGVVAGAVALLTVVAVLVVFRGRSGEPSTASSASAPTPASTPPALSVAPTIRPTALPTADTPSLEASAGPTHAGSGTLIAVAVGGTCTFLVDGAGKTIASTLKVALQAGTHTLVCKLPKGVMKSKVVNIQPDETTTVSFQL